MLENNKIFKISIDDLDLDILKNMLLMKRKNHENTSWQFMKKLFNETDNREKTSKMVFIISRMKKLEEYGLVKIDFYEEKHKVKRCFNPTEKVALKRVNIGNKKFDGILLNMDRVVFIQHKNSL